MELTHYEAAERYLNAVMNGKTSIPLKSWKAERDKLNGGKKELTRQYYALKDEVKEVANPQECLPYLEGRNRHRAAYTGV